LTHKKVNNADAGTTTLFGGNDLDKWSDFASGVDTDDYDINSDFTVRSGKRYLRNPANTFSYQEIASAITANRTVTEPLLTANDTRVYQAHTQTLTNKTISGASNTLSAIPLNSLANVVISSPTLNQVIQYNGTNWVNATSVGGGTGGGSMAAGGSATGSGNASIAVFNIAHGLSPQPDLYWALPASDDAWGNHKLSINATNIVITFAIPPPGTGSSNNLTFHWAAGYLNPATSGFTPSTPTVMTNKTIGDYLDFTRVAVPANPPTDVGRLYHRQIDSNNDGIFVKLKKAGAIVEVQVL
jgi:hypothetical protein